MRARRVVLIVLGVLVLGVVLAGAWAGIVPGLSRWLGPKPRDLGVEMTTKSAYSAANAMAIPTTSAQLKALLAKPDSLKRYDAAFTSEQVSSLLVIGQGDIPNYPLARVQIKLGSKGEAEASGVIRFANVKPFLTDLGVPAAAADAVMSQVKLIGDMPFYLKGTCSVTNNKVALSVAQLEIGRFTVPASWYQGKEGVGTQYIDSALTNNGYKVESLTIDNGQLKMKGERPLSSLGPWLKMAQQ
ncbi:MAG: hypothetical protein HGA39_05615 [Coriobacteriia bacterium]|nr:hypothetical protein [Coriobacteriia bacterium]